LPLIAGYHPRANAGLKRVGGRGPMEMFAALSRIMYSRARGVTSAQVSGASWRKSTFSNYNGSCVEIGRLESDRIGVRDTKDNGAGPVLIFSDHEWSAFISGAKNGQFDNI
jgi:hypothetical protein